MIEESLKKLGFGDHESLVYNALLANSPAGASLLAKKCNLSRSSVYTTLNLLIAKGLVGTTYKNEIKQFIAEGFSPLENIFKKEQDKLEEKFKLLNAIQNEIKILSDKKINIPQIIFFEGQEGLKKIYKSMLWEANNNETMYILRDEFVWEPEWSFIFKPDWHDSIKKRKKEKNLLTKLLINDSLLENQKKEYYILRKKLEFRYLAKDYSLKQFAFYLVGDIVSILSMENNNLIGIRITNRHLAENFRIIFENLWNKSKMS
ncbi:MAG: helix-turn-helix domain-containing protein [bacterium]